MQKTTIGLVAAIALAWSGGAYAQGKPVPEINILTWPAARYQSYFETSNYVAEGWRELGLDVTLDIQPFPNPMLQMWFTQHDFDVVMSVLSGQPQRMEPDFFTNAQFNTKSNQPGDFNVGSFSNETVDRLGAEQLMIYDKDERKKVVDELQRVLYDEQPEAIIATTNYTFAINTAVVDIPGYEEHPDGPRGSWNMLRMTPKEGDVVKIGRTIDQTTFNPLVATTGNDLDNLALVYDKLVELGPDGAVRMWLAESVESTDPTTIVVKLRQGHTFSDGEPVTAEDVKFSFDYFKEWEAVYFKKYLDRVKSVDVVDEHTVQFNLTEPFAPFVMNTLGQMMVVPKHIWENVVEREGIEKPQDYANSPLIGSGAYTLEYFREGQEILLKKRDDHFADPQSDLLIIVFGSAEIVGAALKKGDIHVSFQPIVPTVIEEFAAEPNIKLLDGRSVGYMSMRYNMDREVFQDKALRRALAHAIPYDAIIEEVLGGKGDRSASPIVPSNKFWHNADLPLPEYSIEKARSILAEAGYSWADDGSLLYPEN
jgi:peptide/nickel transport system substrate-binding protein